MLSMFIPTNNPATLLVPAGSRPMLIVNADAIDTLWIGSTNDIIPGGTDAVPISPNGFLSVDGSEDIYAVGDPASVDNGVFVYVIPGGTSFFQLFNQLVIQGVNAGIFIYSPQPGLGNLIGSWSSVAGTDAFGNPFPAGINVNQGQLTGVTLTNANVIGAIVQQAAISDSTISSTSITGGFILETTITFDSSGGKLLMYSTTTTTITQTVNGLYQLNVPANVSVGDISCWAGSSGGSGGSPTEGGEAGGGGGFSRNPSYPLTPGSVVNYQVGNGGTGGNTGNAGTGGEDTTFDTTNAGVVAFGSPAPTGGFQGGKGGAANPAMPISFAGGDGANGSGTASAGGGSSAGTASNGNNGTSSVGAVPGIGGAAPIGGASGGNGVAAAANGNAGGSPGGGGSGAGAANAAVQVNKTYGFSASGTYYGSDASGTPNGKKNSTPSDGTMYQGGETASGGSFNGTQKALAIISGNPAADFAGVTIDSVTMRFSNFHTWYNSGATLTIGHNNRTSMPSSWNAADITVDKNAHINEGATTTFDMSTSGLGAALKSGAAKAITLGPGSGGFNLNNYAGQFGTGGNSSTNPLLTVKGHTTGTNVKAGDGADGKVVIVYASTSVLIAALSPVAGNDVIGNQYAAGYTGPTSAFVPGSSPTIPESVHTMPAMTNGWAIGTGGQAKYMLDSTGALQFSFILNTPGTKTDNITLWAAGSLPVGYRPAVAKRWPVSCGTAAVSANNDPSITFGTDGSITATGINSTGTLSHVDAHGVMPLF